MIADVVASCDLVSLTMLVQFTNKIIVFGLQIVTIVLGVAPSFA